MEIEKGSAIVIISGGLDSTTLLYDVVSQGYQVRALSFDYGQKHRRELEMARKTCERLGVEHKILNLYVLNDVGPSALTRVDRSVPEGHYADENMKQTIVPSRNLTFISLATAYAISTGARRIFYGAHAGDFSGINPIYPDCSPKFVDAVNEVLRVGNWEKIELVAPYLNMDKSGVAEKAKELNVDLSLTQTCYNGKPEACGCCGSCVERVSALDKVGLVDPILYQKGWDATLDHVKKVLNK